MNEEEKKAIDWLKNELDDEKKSCKNCNYSYKGVTGLYGNNEVEIALKLIEKQQKEIEKYSEIFKNTEETTLYADGQPIQKIIELTDYISKDKIREKIKELKEEINLARKEKDLVIEAELEIQIEVLKELLGE